MVGTKGISCRAAFLDRDGVLNRCVVRSGVPTRPRDRKEVSIIEGVLDSIILFRKNGIIPVVITNQPDVARGITTKEKVQSINKMVGQLTDIEHFYVCFHDDSDDCKCRKPRTELILNAARDLNIDMGRSFLVGDRWRDIKAGQSIGLKSYFIDYSYSELQPNPPFIRVSSLKEVAQLESGVKNGAKN